MATRETRMRIFIGLVEVAGRNSALKRGLEEIGHSVTLVVLSDHWAQYDMGRELAVARWLRKLGERRRCLGPSSGPAVQALRLLDLGLRGALFLYLLCTHDVFIYSSGTSFFRHWDYALIRRLRKTLICQFHGSDARPPYLNGAYVARSDFSIERCIAATRQMKGLMRLIDRLASAVINLPTHGYFHERPYILGFRVGFPCGPHGEHDESGEEYEDELRPAPGSIRVLHAPSRPAIKGTRLIREAVHRLVLKGHPIEYVELTGRPQRDVLDEMRRCTLVVDQLYSDYPYTGIVSEAAWLGKPALTCGHAVEFWKELLTDEELPPAIYCRPEEFEPQLERLVADARLRADLGRKMHAHVRRLHHPTVVARRYVAVARGDVPASWRFDPQRMTAVAGGFFMPEEQAKALVRTMVSEAGVESLQLADKPATERAVLEWAGVPLKAPVSPPATDRSGGA